MLKLNVCDFVFMIVSYNTFPTIIFSSKREKCSLTYYTLCVSLTLSNRKNKQFSQYDNTFFAYY